MEVAEGVQQATGGLQRLDELLAWLVKEEGLHWTSEMDFEVGWEEST